MRVLATVDLDTFLSVVFDIFVKYEHSKLITKVRNINKFVLTFKFTVYFTVTSYKI